MNAIFKARAFIEKIILGACCFFMFMTSFLIILQVAARSLRIGINWTEELARISFVLVTFLGSSLVITKGYHISITFLADMLPKPIRKVLDVLIQFAMAGFMCVCVYGSTLLMAAAKGVRSNTLQWLHLNYVYGLVMAGCVLMIIACLLRALELIVGSPETNDGQEGEIR